MIRDVRSQSPYEATGQIGDGQLKLTIPANWSPPTSANVEVKTKGTGASVGAMADMLFGGDAAKTKRTCLRVSPL